MRTHRILQTALLLVALGSLAPVPRSAAQTAPATNAPPARSKPADPLNDLFGNTVIARGKGVEVKRGQLDQAIIGIKGAAAARGQNISPDDLRVLEQRVLDRMIQIQLLQSRATDADKTKGKELAEKRFEQIKTTAGGEDGLSRNLKSVGMSIEELRKNIAEEAVAESVVQRELTVTLTDEQIKKYYDETPARFEIPEMVRASHILLATRDPKTATELSDEQKSAKRKTIDELLKRARAGEDFAKLVKEYSDDNASKEKGGEYTFPRGQMFPPEFEAAAFSLGTNQVSDVVTTSFGYHIIKLNDRIPAKKEPFNGAETHTIMLKQDGQNVTIRDILNEQELQKQIPVYIARLKKEAGVEILDERLILKETAGTRPGAGAP